MISVPYSTQAAITSTASSLQKRDPSTRDGKNPVWEKAVAKTERRAQIFPRWHPYNDRYLAIQDLKVSTSNAEVKAVGEQFKSLSISPVKKDPEIKSDKAIGSGDEIKPQKRSPGENAARGGRGEVDRRLEKWQLRVQGRINNINDVRKTEASKEAELRAEERKAAAALARSQASQDGIFSEAMNKAIDG